MMIMSAGAVKQLSDTGKLNSQAVSWARAVFLQHTELAWVVIHTPVNIKSGKGERAGSAVRSMLSERILQSDFVFDLLIRRSSTGVSYELNLNLMFSLLLW